MTFPINIRTLPLHFLWLFHGQNLKMTSIKDMIQITSALAVASGFWTHFTFIYMWDGTWATSTGCRGRICGILCGWKSRGDEKQLLNWLGVALSLISSCTWYHRSMMVLLVFWSWWSYRGALCMCWSFERPRSFEKVALIGSFAFRFVLLFLYSFVLLKVVHPQCNTRWLLA